MPSALRLGLCCQFRDEPITFRTTTATAMLRLNQKERLKKLSELCLGNARSLLAALHYCHAHGIGCFRILSSILPVRTHPVAGYAVEDLPEAETVIEAFRQCGAFSREQGIRTVFHPDQFVVLNSPKEEVVERSIADLEAHAELAEWVAADVINIHGGGAYGNKTDALTTFARNLDRLSDAARRRLTVENDDGIFTPADLIPLCRSTGLPLVYDVHHHRCLSDGWSVGEATEHALSTWTREPLFHLSSPLDGWNGPKPERHHDFIDPADFPAEWRNLAVTVEVEAKAKEVAVLKLKREMTRKGAKPPSRKKPMTR